MPDLPLPPQPSPAEESSDPSAGTGPSSALLRDLRALSAYLQQRGQQTYETAQKFADNARRHPESRAYDERQATMLEYQHYIWKEIAGLLDRLIIRYDSAVDETDSPEQE
jgi:hypothetical protein